MRAVRCGPIVVAAAALAACIPAARPLTGTPVPARLPATGLAPGYRKVVFDWTFTDGEFDARGEGVARIAPPDSVRLDLFASGAPGGGAGAAVLIGDALTMQGGDDQLARALFPAAPLLWASLGRLSVPPAADTIARVDGDTLRTDIGHAPTWRATFVTGRLVRLERVTGGKLREWVARVPAPNAGEAGTGSAGGRIRFGQGGSRRALSLTIRRTEDTQAFDAAIWTP